MRIGRIESIEVLAALCLALACPPAWSAVETLEMQVGESRVLAQPGVTRVAIGNSQVLSAVATDDREVVVSARAEGVSSMHVWAEAGLASYDVRVVAAGTPRLLAEVDSLLARIPGTRSTLVGSQVVIEGEGLSDDDRARVAALAQRYPEVVDFTGQVGWDSMVLLDVQVVEIPSSRLRELGVRWDGVTQGGAERGAGLGRRLAGQDEPARRATSRHPLAGVVRGRLFRRQCVAVGPHRGAGPAWRSRDAGPAAIAGAQRRQRDLSCGGAKCLTSRPIRVAIPRRCSSPMGCRCGSRRVSIATASSVR